MTPTSVELQIYYEIAMAIGNSLDIRKMLGESLSVYLRRLNCASGLVLIREGGDAEGWRFSPFFSIPRNLGRNAACQKAVGDIPSPMSGPELAAFRDSLPISGAGDGGRFYHLMDLPGFGLLLLVRSGEPFGHPVLQSLLRLNRKLADSCIACRQNETIEGMNRQLSHEIAERRRAESQLKALLDEMENRVAARTEELASANRRLRQEITDREATEAQRRELEEKLARSKKMESLGVLAGGVAHDLNNVLSGIVGFPDLLLLKLPEDSPLAEPIRLIRESGKKAAAIVEDLLTLARRGVVQKEVVDLNEIIRTYLASPEHGKLRDYHPGVSIETDLEADLPAIKGSPIHLRQTVMNLVSNAAESESRQVTIVTRDRHVQAAGEAGAPAPGNYVRLTVADDGVGISGEEISRIFEPFYTKKVMGRSGTGLGMSVVWGTVQDHGGFIDVKSDKGAGAAFDLYFPVTSEAPSEAASAFPLEILRGKGESILVVDDVAEQREIAGSLLKTLGYAPTAVDSGEAALDHVRRRPADAILLDMIMEPGMDGLETYRRILDVRPGQKAVIASGYSETDRVKEALKLGASAYIRKPYSLKQLGVAMKRCLLGG